MTLVARTAAGYALSCLDRLDHYQVGDEPQQDRAVCAHVTKAIEGLPWITGLPVKTLLWGAGCIVGLRSGTTLDRLEAPKRLRLTDSLRRIPLFPMLDKLIVTVAYLRAFDEQPLAGSGPD